MICPSHLYYCNRDDVRRVIQAQVQTISGMDVSQPQKKRNERSRVIDNLPGCVNARFKFCVFHVKFSLSIWMEDDEVKSQFFHQEILSCTNVNETKDETKHRTVNNVAIFQPFRAENTSVKRIISTKAIPVGRKPKVRGHLQKDKISE
eukprot:767056-Hanusia_phi.AAC.1